VRLDHGSQPCTAETCTNCRKTDFPIHETSSVMNTRANMERMRDMERIVGSRASGGRREGVYLTQPNPEIRLACPVPLYSRCDAVSRYESLQLCSADIIVHRRPFPPSNLLSTAPAPNSSIPLTPMRPVPPTGSVAVKRISLTSKKNWWMGGNPMCYRNNIRLMLLYSGAR
jgi:hypothetical protein